MKLKINTNGNIPIYATEHSAGIDLYTNTKNDIIIKPKQTQKISTGLKVQIPKGHFGAIYPRSSTGVKKHLMLANTIGVIDSDYRGEIFIFFYNYGDKDVVIKNNERLAQLVIQPYVKCEIENCDSLDDSSRGENGFGSTGE